MTTDQQQKLFDYMEQEHNVLLLHSDFAEIESILEDRGNSHLDKFTPYQLCPKCQGQKTVQKPPDLPGDQHQWTSVYTSFICEICGGSGLILMHRTEKRDEQA